MADLIMRDSTNPLAIPADTPIVAGYGDGIYQWTSTSWARFPNSVKLSIVINATDRGDILDVERGAASPSDVPGWCDRFSRVNRRGPSVYVNRGNWPAVYALVGARPDYWVATLDGSRNPYFGQPGVPAPPDARVVAVQHCGAAGSGDPCQSAGDWDESVVLDVGWVFSSEVGMWLSSSLTGVFDASGVMSDDGRPTWVFVKALDAGGFRGNLFWTQFSDGVPAKVDPISLTHGAHFRSSFPGFQGGWTVVPDSGFEYAHYTIAVVRV